MAKARWLQGSLRMPGLWKVVTGLRARIWGQQVGLASGPRPHCPCWWARDAGVWFVFAAARGQPAPANTLLSVCPERWPRLPEMPPQLVS